MRGGHLLERAGREFARNLAWMLAVFAAPAAMVAFGAGLPLLGVLAFGGLLVSVLAAVVTVLALFLGVEDEALLGAGGEGGRYSGGHYYPASSTAAAGAETAGAPVMAEATSAVAEETEAAVSNP